MRKEKRIGAGAGMRLVSQAGLVSVCDIKGWLERNPVHLYLFIRDVNLTDVSARQKLTIRRAVRWVIFLLHPSLYQNSGDRGLPSVASVCETARKRLLFSLHWFLWLSSGLRCLGSEVWILKDISTRNQKAVCWYWSLQWWSLEWVTWPP